MTITRVLAVLAVTLTTGLAHAQGTPSLDVTKLSIKLNFAKPAADNIQLKALVPVRDGFVVAGRMVVVNVGGVARTFVLDEKGKGVSEGAQVKLTVKSQKGVVAAQDAKFSFKLTKRSVAADLADEGLVDATIDDQLLIVGTDVTIDGQPSPQTVDVRYKAKAGKTGKASGK
jgi:hypothetical protein